MAREFLARLNDLETLLSKKNLAPLGDKLEVPDIDAVPRYMLAKNREALLEEIKGSRKFFRELLEP